LVERVELSKILAQARQEPKHAIGNGTIERTQVKNRELR